MGSGPSLEVTGRQAVDPATQRRQEHLFRQAEGFAAQQPFQRQYGYGTQMVPGLSGMSQTGQAYLSDKILGKGAYAAQDLGFQQYRRPTSATAGGYQYGQSGYMPGQEFQPGYAGGRYRVGAPPEGGDASMAWGGGGYTAGDGIGRDEGDGGGDLSDAELEALGQYDDETLASGETVRRYIQPGEWARRAQYGVTPYEPTTGESIAGVTGGSWAGAAPDRYTGLMYPQGEADDFAPWDPRPDLVSESQELNPMYEQNVWNEYERSDPFYNQPSFGLQNVPDAASAAQYVARGGDPTATGYTGPATGGGLLQTDLGRPTAGVGIGEVEDARTATRRMLLEQGRTGDLGYDQFLPGAAADGATAAVDPGWLEQGTAGTGTAPTAAQTGIGALSPWQQVSYDPETGERIVEEGTYAPEYDAVGAGGVTGAADDLRYSDPTTDPLYKDWTTQQLGLREADEVTDILGTQATGKAFREGWGITDPTISGTDWTGATPWDEAVEAGEVDVTKITTPTLTDAERIGATEVGAAGTAGFGVTPKAIAAPTTVSVDPITGEITEDVAAVAPGTIAGPGAVAVDPVTGQATQAVAGVTPGAIAGPSGVTVDPVTGRVSEGIGGAVTPGGFSGASFLTGDLDPYMNQLGIQSQIEAAQLDYGRAQNEEQARRAASHAWGTRGDIPRAEQEQQMLARIADIRRQGFSDAADRMEFDLQRQQAAGMQYQQLQMQGQLAGREEESQRREANAARAQQAGLAGQQLGTQAALQTQQLRQAGDIRGAELGLQAGLQGQQLEAQRRSEDAARAQQAALAGQQLGTQAAMQTQQLGQAGGIRGAELGLQAQMQGQQLQAQRRESDAARAQQAAMQGLQLGTQADLQTQQLTQQGGIRGTELGVQTGMQAQQLEAQRLEANAARTQQAALAGQQLGGQYGLQTQALGQQAAMRNAEMEMQAALANQQAALQTGTQSQQLEAQRQIEQARLKLAGQQQTQQLGVQTGLAAQGLEAQRAESQAGRAQQAALTQYQAGIEGGMQTQRLGVGADQRQAELDMQAALANQQAALQTGGQAAQLEAGRRGQQAQLDLQRLQQTQQLGAGAAAQQAALESARRQGLAEMGMGAQGMGMDDQARFRQQQMQLAEQLGRQGMDEQAATFGAAQQLAQMGGTQEQRQQMQAAADYEQWLRSQEGFADEAAFLQAMQPTPSQMQYQRKPSVWGQVAGGLLSAGGAAATAFGSDVRIKDNIEYVGMENGFKTYEFNYLGRDNRYRGVMAQEVMLERPDAVEMQDGFYRVNYDAIGVQFEAI